MQTRTCPRCSSWFSEDQIDGEFSGMCPKCLASALQESHAGGSDVIPSNPGLAAPISARGGALRPGERFGGFEILGVLGQGGMGVVYKARQTSLDRIVALKVLAPRIAGSEEFARRFDHEAKVLAAVNHPNVVQVHDFGRQGDVHHLVMEYVDGESLEDAFRRGRLEPERLLRILRDVARGLGRVHSVGLVHRDLKPANILIARDGTAKIGDFGLAVESQGVQRLTEQGYFVGTPHYVSPEHAKGEKVDPRSDLYAVGVMLYEGFAGRPPFEAASPTAVLVKHIEAAVPPLGDAPRDVQALVTSLLRKDPAERPASAAEVEWSIDRLLSAPATKRVAPARIAIVAAVAAIVLSLVAYMTWTPPVTGSALLWLVAAVDALKVGDDEGARRSIEKGLRTGDSTWDAQLNAVAMRAAELRSDRPAKQDDEEYGAFLCFSRRDWERGLPLIAAGDASPWRELARKELSPTPNPKELGAGWLAAATKAEKPRWAERMRERAWAWFSAAGDTARMAELDNVLECRREIDLIALANPEKFSVAGEFRVEKGTLRTPPSTAAARMSIPYLPPDEFDLSLDVERRTGQGVLYVGVPGFSAEISGNPRKVSVTVRRDGMVSATADADDVIVKTTRVQWRTPEPRLIVVGSDASAFVVSKMTLRGCPPLIRVKERSSDAASIDLLTLVQPAQDAVKGEWSFSDGALKCRSASPAILQIPYVPPDEYDLTLVAVRKEGVGSLNIGLAKGESQFMAVFDGCGDQGYKYGLHLVDGHALSSRENETATKGRSIVNGQEYRIVCLVRHTGVQVFFDEMRAIRWNGNFNRLANEGFWRVPSDRALFLGAFDGGFRFTEIKLTPRSGQGRALRSEIVGPPVELLSRVRPERDNVKGEWKLVDGMLVSPATPEARIELPVEAPSEYDLVVTAERRSTDQRSFHIGLPIGGRGVLVTIDGFGTDRCALENLDGKPSTGEGLTYLRQVFKEVGVPVTLTCEVRRNSLTVRSGELVILSWKGDPSRLELPGQWRGIHAKAPLLGAFRSEFRIRKIELIPVSGAARLLAENGTDLLALVDPVRDAVAGKWARSGAGIINEADQPFPRLLFPVTAPDEYDLILDAERKEGLRSLIIGFTSGPAQATVLIDGWTGTITGLDLLDNKGADTNETSVKGTSYLRLDRRASIIVSVRKSGVKLEIDGRQVFDWKGDSSRLTLHKNLEIPRKGLFLAAWDSRFLIHRFTLVPVTGSTRTVDLLPLIDPVRDAVQGAFTKEGTSLVTPKGQVFSKIMIPVVPPQEYELTLDAVRRSGGDMIGLGIVHDGRQVMAVVGGQSGETGGLEMLGGLNFMLNKSRFEHPFLEVGKPFLLKVTVRRSGIEAALNGKQVLSWSGDSKELSLYHEWRVPDRTRMFVASQGSSFEVRRLVMAPLSETVDLLERIDLDRHVVSGGWKRKDGALVSSGVDLFSRVMSPGRVPEEYDLEIDLVRTNGASDFYLGLVQGKNQFGVMLDAGDSSYSAVQGRVGDLVRYKGSVFVDNQPSKVRVRVRVTGIEVRVDDRVILSYTGDLGQGSMFPQWAVPDKRSIFFGAHNTVYEIRRAVLHPFQRR